MILAHVPGVLKPSSLVSLNVCQIPALLFIHPIKMELKNMMLIGYVILVSKLFEIVQRSCYQPHESIAQSPR